MVLRMDLEAPARAQQDRIELLEREGRLPELAAELAATAAHTDGAERAQLLARLGQVRLRLDDGAGALAAFSESLSLEPTQPVSRRWLEILLSEPEYALQAADILEPLYEREYRREPHAASLLLALLELRANRATDIDERIAAWVQLDALFDHAAAPADRQREVSARMLQKLALEWPGGLSKWIERVTRGFAVPAERVEVLLAALNQPLAEPNAVQELRLAAGEALSLAGRSDEALICYEGALESDPSCPEVLARIDALAGEAGESLELRAARYARALELAADPQRRAALAYALGVLQREAGDTTDAIASFQRAVADEPGLLGAHEALVVAFSERGDVAAVHAELERALPHLSPGGRNLAWLRLIESFSSQGRSAEALEHCRALLDEPGLDEVALGVVQRACEEVKDLDGLRKVHEKRLEAALDRDERARALERLGDFFGVWLSDTSAAARTFRAAAELCLDAPEATLEAQRLYERALAALPSDSESAQRLIELYARTRHWGKLGELFKRLLPGTGDAAIALLLPLESRAVQAGASGEYADLVDALLGELGGSLAVEQSRSLLGSKARAFAGAARYEDAAGAYEQLIELFADERDVRAYVGLVDASPTSAFRHGKRRWLLEWRTRRAADPVAVLVHWAKVEEQEFGDAAAAAVLLERAAALDADRVEAWQELARTRMMLAEPAGALAALERVRELAPANVVLTLELTLASLLVEQLNRPHEALALLESVLKSAPDDAAARRLALELSADPVTCLASARALEEATRGDTPSARGRLLLELLAHTAPLTTQVDALAERRRGWYREGLDSCAESEALAWAERAAAELPEQESAWERVEARSLAALEPLAAVRAYQAALERCTDPRLAELLGRRLVRFADEHVGQPRALAPALERLLSLVHDARWAFERIKFALSSEQRWDALFPLYDQMIAAAVDEDEQAALLDQAAIAARDVAGDADRAIDYWSQYFALRPADARVDLALERLYERQKKTLELITHLLRREPKLEGVEQSQLRERVAGLWLDLGEGPSALRVVLTLPAADALAGSTLRLLERIFELEQGGSAAGTRDPEVAREAADHLKQRYAKLGRPAEVVRVLKAELRLAERAVERRDRLAHLAELQRELSDAEGEFASLGELLLLEPEQDAHRQRLGELSDSPERRAALGELLVQAADSRAQSKLFPRLLFDAADIWLGLGQASRAAALLSRVVEESPELKRKLAAAQALERLLLASGQAEERCAVLWRIAELDPTPSGRRAALLEAARVALDELGDAARSARAYEALLEREPTDRELMDGLVRSLQFAEEWDKLVAVLSRRAELEPNTYQAHRDLAAAARVFAARLAAPERAIETWYAIRQRFGHDTESFEALSGLLEDRLRWDELCALLQQEALVATDPVPLYARLAQVHRLFTGDQKAALAAYVLAGDVVSAGELLCESQGLVTDDPSLPLELSYKLEEAQGFAEAERLLRRQLEHYGPRRPPRSIAVHLRLAELLHHAGRTGPALVELGAAVEHHPSSAALLAALGALALQEAELERAEQSYRALLLLLGSGTQEPGVELSRAEVYLLLADIAQKRGRAQQAEDHVASAFEAALGSEEEALALEGALRRRGLQALLERAIAERLERTRDPLKIATALCDLLEASMVFGELEPTAAERARRTAERAGATLTTSTPPSAWFALVAVYDRLGDVDGACELLERFVGSGAPSQELTLAELELARRWLGRPERRSAAIAQLWSSVRRDAVNAEAWELLLGALSEPAAREELLSLVDAQLQQDEKAGDRRRIAALRWRRAELVEQLGRREEALDLYRSLLSNDDDGQRALRSVARLQEELGAPPLELAASWEAVLATERGERAAALAQQLYDLRLGLGDEAGALRALEWGFAADPRHAGIIDALLTRYAASGNWQAAVERLEQAVALAPQEASLKLRLAQAYHERGTFEEALQMLGAATDAGAGE
ncbi:MAG TPA: tetratricopeptide repeat protein, partial [Polyangiaceae bacterium]|nr:tetratricopeptide repeat protein [Polyangiaceae bacterium]